MTMQFIQILAVGAGLLASVALAFAADDKPRRPPEGAKPLVPARLLEQLDKNKNGSLDRDEVPGRMMEQFDRIDANKDGVLDRDELMAARRRGGGGRPGEVITPAAKGERLPDRLRVGDPAPDFTLPSVSGKGEVTLSRFRGKRPVVLIFASYT
jgi:hypothetical protein